MTHTKSSTEQAIEQLCPDCHHSLVDNNHGFDQNDGWMEGDKLVHSGQCTYCKECNPRLNAAALAREQATPIAITLGHGAPPAAAPLSWSEPQMAEFELHPSPSARAAIAADELVEGCADIRVPNVQFGGTNGLDSAQREAILALKGRYALTEVPMETYSDDYVRIPKVTLECLEARNSELCNIGFDLGMVIPERCLQVRAEVVKRISPLTDAECTEHDKPLVGEAESERERVIEECARLFEPAIPSTILMVNVASEIRALKSRPAAQPKGDQK